MKNSPLGLGRSISRHLRRHLHRRQIDLALSFIRMRLLSQSLLRTLLHRALPMAVALAAPMDVNAQRRTKAPLRSPTTTHASGASLLPTGVDYKTATNPHAWGGPSSASVSPAERNDLTPAAATAVVVFSQYGNAEYLRYSLEQAKRSNPRATVVLLGDDTNRGFPGIEHVPLAAYATSADGFARYYQHFNTTSYRYELFNFQRWFILRDFLSQEGISRCLYLDSDTMLYGDIAQEGRRFADFGLTLSGMTSGNTCFVNRLETLDAFCDFLLAAYTRTNRYDYDRLVAQFALRRRHHLRGGTCDMTALHLFMLDHYAEIGEVARVQDGTVFDPNINLSDPGFEMENGHKKVTWQDDVPFGRYLRTDERIRFNSLHFQGAAAKHWMKDYLR